MDPNKALATIRRLTAKYAFEGGSELTSDDAVEFFDAVEALDGWLSQGGFLPDGWQDARGGAGEGPIG